MECIDYFVQATTCTDDKVLLKSPVLSLLLWRPVPP